MILKLSKFVLTNSEFKKIYIKNKNIIQFSLKKFLIKLISKNLLRIDIRRNSSAKLTAAFPNVNEIINRINNN